MMTKDYNGTKFVNPMDILGFINEDKIIEWTKIFIISRTKHTLPGHKSLYASHKYIILSQNNIEWRSQIYYNNNLIYRNNGKTLVAQWTLPRSNENISKNRRIKSNSQIPQTRNIVSVGNENPKFPKIYSESKFKCIRYGKQGAQ